MQIRHVDGSIDAVSDSSGAPDNIPASGVFYTARGDKAIAVPLRRTTSRGPIWKTTEKSVFIRRFAFPSEASAVAFSPWTAEAAAAFVPETEESAGGKLLLYDAAGYSPHSISVPWNLTCLSFVAGPRYVAGRIPSDVTGSDMGPVWRLWDRRTGLPVRDASGKESLDILAFRHDGRYLTSQTITQQGVSFYRYTLVQPASGKEWEIPGSGTSARIVSACFSPDGYRLVTLTRGESTNYLTLNVWFLPDFLASYPPRRR